VPKTNVMESGQTRDFSRIPSHPVFYLVLMPIGALEHNSLLGSVNYRSRLATIRANFSYNFRVQGPFPPQHSRGDITIVILLLLLHCFEKCQKGNDFDGQN